MRYLNGQLTRGQVEVSVQEVCTTPRRRKTAPNNRGQIDGQKFKYQIAGVKGGFGPVNM